MANVNVTIRMDADLRKKATALFDDLGMGFNQALNIFVRQAVREQRIPFEITRNVPNKETLKAFEEAELIKSGKANYKEYADVDEMFEDALKWNTK